MVKVKDRWKMLLSFLLALLNSYTMFAQEDAPGRIPPYPPYEYPTVDGIKEELNRVRVYYESTSPLKIVDSKTGKEITEFSQPNKNARVSNGFAGEWSYTNGVVLSAFEYIDDVTGDPDDWERRNGLDPNDPEDRNKVAADGYTMLEKYINSLTE